MLDGKILEFDSYCPDFPGHTCQSPKYADAHPRFRGGGTGFFAEILRVFVYAFAPLMM